MDSADWVPHERTNNTMTSDQVVDLLRQALMAAFFMALPLLAVGFVVGIVMSLAQVLTSIQDSAFSTVPRLVVYLGAIIFMLPWLVHRSMAYTSDLLIHLDKYVR